MHRLIIQNLIPQDSIDSLFLYLGIIVLIMHIVVVIVLSIVLWSHVLSKDFEVLYSRIRDARRAGEELECGIPLRTF